MAIEKKKFFEIELPIINEKVDLLATSEQKLIGRTVRIDLTRKLRGKSLEAIFKITADSQGKLKVQPFRLAMFGYFIRRMMRKSISYVEDSLSLDCKDAVLRIKTFMITRKQVSRAVLNAVRIKAKETIISEIKEKSYEEVFTDILNNKFQKNLSLTLKKIYPLAFCEIRDIFVEKEKQIVQSTVASAAISPEPTAEKV